MKAGNLAVFAFLIWPSTALCSQKENTCQSSTGILGHIINKTLESLRPDLANLYIKSKDFETGHQEFGSFLGTFKDVKVEGLEKFSVKTLRTSGLDIANLTVVEENFNAKGLYGINGSMIFPLGKSDIHLFGNGNFGAKFTNLSISMKMKIRSENGTKIVKEFDMFVGFKRIEVYFRNLMGGGDLEKAFNQIINVVALPVFDYYKETVLDAFKIQVTEFINKILNKNDEKLCHVLENNLDC